ncbi:MAG TPA: cyclic nucleotide-binding domain-containing protein [Elusimicrobiota bacterium]|nr:cyclic nucleotide-binding domain-containing protein [Elusimicrobiota bacterium]
MPFDDTLFLKKQVDIMAALDENQLRTMTPDIEHHTYKNGQTVLMKGEITDQFFIIKTGRVVVLATINKEKTQVAELKAGDFFGEISFLESTSATATIRSLEDNTEILVIPGPSFRKLMQLRPDLEKALRQKVADRKQQKVTP